LSDWPSAIPLFPLPNVVLFPKMALPLHIFEPRYRQMTSQAWNTHRLIGMTLLRPGWEPDYHGRPPVYPIGCAGRIEQCEALSDGRYNVVLRGLARFRILEEHAGEPYRVATVEALIDSADQSASRLGELRRRLHAAVFVNALGQSMDLTPVERQSLLDCDSIQGRYERLLEILDFKALESTYGQPGTDKIH
jgi:Lon protease-like protein